METTYQKAQGISVPKSQAETSAEGKISKKALVAFISGAAIVFAIAIYYCINTSYTQVAGILTGAFAIICIFASIAYRSFR